MDVWEWMCECMSLQRHSCAQTLDRGERCLGPDLQCQSMCMGMHVWANVFTMPFLCICQYCPRTGEKVSEVEQPRGADAKLPGCHPPPHWTRRGLLNEVMFGELRILLFVCFRSVHGWIGMDVWVNVCLYDAILLRRPWTVEKEHLPSFLTVAHHHTGQEEDK